MNEWTRAMGLFALTALANDYCDYLERDDLLALSIKLSKTPCIPLCSGAVSSDRELRLRAENLGVVV